MAANILSSNQAVEASVQVVRAFVRLRRVITTNNDIAVKFVKVESHLAKHDHEIRSIFEAIRQLITPPASDKKQIGFRPKSLKK